MNNLTLFKQENFGEIKCNLLRNEDNEIFMTSNQLSEILGYSSKDSFKSLLGRNTYIKYDLEFSRVVSYCNPLGGTQETRVFTEDGIYEIAMLSKTEVAKQFRSWIRKVLKGLRTQELILMKTQLLDNQEKANNYELITNANNCLSMLEMSRLVKMGRNTLFKLLRDEEILMSKGERKNIPYEQYIKSGYFRTIASVVINGNIVKNVIITTVTAKGIDFIVKILKKK